MKKIVLICFLLNLILILVINIFAFVYGIHGTKYGMYLNTFNIIEITIQFVLNSLLNKLDKEK